MAGIIFVAAILVVAGAAFSLILGSWWPLIVAVVLGIVFAFLPKE